MSVLVFAHPLALKGWGDDIFSLKQYVEGLANEPLERSCLRSSPCPKRLGDGVFSLKRYTKGLANEPLECSCLRSSPRPKRLGDNVFSPKRFAEGIAPQKDWGDGAVKSRKGTSHVFQKQPTNDKYMYNKTNIPYAQTILHNDIIGEITSIVHRFHTKLHSAPYGAKIKVVSTIF